MINTKPPSAKNKPQSVDDLVLSIRIPPRPSLLADLQQEIERPEPNLKKLSRIVEKDAALSGAFLKMANSAFYSRSRKVNTVEGALTGLGLNQVSLLAGGFLVRESFHSKNDELSDFWESSTRRSISMVYLARELGAGSPDLARSFGLFADIGIPLLMERFSSYTDTLRKAHDSQKLPFTKVEEEQHHTNHAVIGALLAHNWKLPEEVVTAIGRHHDDGVFAPNEAPLSVRRLIALGNLSDSINQHYLGHPLSAEMQRIEPLALNELGVGNDELDDLTSTVHELFAREAC